MEDTGAVFVVLALPGDESAARLLLDDLTRVHPERDVLVLSDGMEGAQPLGSLSCDGVPYSQLRLCWELDDLRACLVPAALRAGLARRPSAILLRPGMRVLAPLPALEPHSGLGLVTAPGASVVVIDDRDPGPADALAEGIASHGVVVARRSGDALLTVWERSSSPRWWRDEPALPLFTVAAQRALAAGASLLPSESLLADPVWGWTGAGTPLLDLSSVSPHSSWVLNPALQRPRVLLSEHPHLASIVSLHARQLTIREPAPSQSRLLARLARRWLASNTTSGYDDWLAAPGDTQPPSPVPRGLVELWESRADLRGLIPRGLQHDARALATWWCEHGRGEQPFPPTTAAAIEALRAADLDVAVPDPTPGITVAGYVGATLGLGRMARLIIQAAQTTELPVSIVENHRTSSRRGHDRPELPEGLLHTLTLVAVTGDQLPSFVADMPADWRKDRKTIGVWAWELDTIPDSHRHAFNLVDEVWTISEFSRQAMAAVAPCPVALLPLPVPVPAEPPSAAAINALRARLGLPESYFLFVFDLLSDLERKNPLGLIEAHRRAFPDGEGPALVLKVLNTHLKELDAERLRLACHGRAVHLVEAELPQAEVDTLMAGALAYVSLHRSEGFGLTLAEAMALGVPCVATGYGGNLDFMTEDVSVLIPFEVVETPPHSAYAGGRWAEPEVERAAAALRQLAAEPVLARELGQRGREQVAGALSLERCGSFLRTQLYQVEDERQAQELVEAHSRAAARSLTRRVARRVLGGPGR